MRETGFIEQNRKKWNEYERVLKDKKKDPDQLSDLYIEVTDDLSYSRTFYPNRSVRVYLNGLAQRIFSDIYKQKRGKKGMFIQFWVEDLPQILWYSRKELLASFLVFAVCMVIGALSTHYDPEFPKIILSDQYVQMTDENIAAGDPMAVYKDGEETFTFLWITWNNLTVALRAFLFGAVFLVGTLIFMVINGVMVGSFQYYFIQKGVFWDSFLAIWMHGTFEISAIIIAGGAGIVMGKGLIFPGTYTRIQSFQVGALRGLKIMLGLVPVFIMAGFIEGFFTRLTETPNIVRGGVITVSGLIILAYFVVYPWIKARSGFKHPLEEKKFPPTQDETFDHKHVKSNGEVFTGTFSFYKKYFSKIFVTGVVLSILSVVAIRFTGFKDLLKSFVYTDDFWFNLTSFFELIDFYIFLVIIVLGLSGILYIIQRILSLEIPTDEDRKKVKWSALLKWDSKAFVSVLIALGIGASVLLIPGGFAIFCILILAPLIFLQMAVMHWEKSWPLKAISRSFDLMGADFGRFIGLYLILLLMTALYELFISSPTLFFLFQGLQWNLALSPEIVAQVFALIFCFIVFWSIYMAVPLSILGMYLVYFSLKEIKDATHLKERIAAIGKKKKMYGLENVE